MFKTFNLRVWLKMLCQQGMQTASLPRWTGFDADKSRARKELRVPVPLRILSTMKAKYGVTAEWGICLAEHMVGDISYRCGSPDEIHGDSNIGYFTTDTPPRYEVGRIKQILKVRTARDTRSEVVFLVNRYKSAAASYTAVVCERFNHEALRLHVASVHTEDSADVVLMDQLVGHIAMKRFADQGGIMLTIQLSKVRHLLTSLNSDEWVLLQDIERRRHPSIEESQ